MSSRNNLTERRFGSLTAKTFAGTKGAKSRPRSSWMCLCDCGTMVEVQTSNLLRGNSQSCGCGLTGDPQNQKQCSKCLLPKPLKKFQWITRDNRYEAKCRDCINQEARQRYEQNPLPKLTRSRRWRTDNPEAFSASRQRAHRTARWALKLEVIAYYGGMCKCCGEDSIYFLQIDHIDGGGRKQRALIGISGGVNFYAWLRKQGFPPGFRVLCSNCNSALGAYGFCPHQGRGKQLELL